MTKRIIRTVITNRDLADSIFRIEGRQDKQETAINKLQEEVAPLQKTLVQIQGGVTLIKWMVAAVGFLATAVELARAFRP